MPTPTYTLAECERRAREAREYSYDLRGKLFRLDGDEYAVTEWAMLAANKRALRWERRATALRAQAPGEGKK